MSQITKDINKITGTIIEVSGKLILYALILLLLTEGIVRGYAFGHTIFYQTPMEPAPGSNKVLTVTAEDSGADIAAALKDLGLIDNRQPPGSDEILHEYEAVRYVYLNTSMTSRKFCDF